MFECVTPWNILISLFNHNLANQCAEVFNSPAFDGSFDLHQYLPYFIKTILLELPLYFLFLKGSKSFKQILLINLIINLATHPAVFYLIPFLINKFNLNYLQYILVAETFAPVVEALLLQHVYKIPAKTAWLAAIVTNIVSWSIGIYIS